MIGFLKKTLIIGWISILSSYDVSTMKEIQPFPELADVGAANMPKEIAPVYSPYFEARFSRPTFPNLVLVVQYAHENLQSKLDELGKRGGGTLILKEGNYLSGRLTLHSNTELRLEQGAVLTFKSQIEDFLPVVFTRNEGIEMYSLGACIYANGATNIAITGRGRLIGPGEGTVRQKTMTHEVIEKVVDVTSPVHTRIYDGKTADYIFPPALIAPINCKNVFIEGITLERSAFWNIVPTYCQSVVIRGVSIQSQGIQRGDGIDIESSKQVLIEYCTLQTGDDCIALKAGRGLDGLRVNKPTEQVVVRNCLTKTGHGALTIGSETAGLIQQVYVHDCVFAGTDVGIRFKTRRPRGGGGKDFYFSNIRMDVNFSALRWDMLGQAQHVGQDADRTFKVPINVLTPRFSGIIIDRISIDRSLDCIKIEGIPESVLRDVKFSRIVGHGTRFLSAKDAENIQIYDSHFTCADRQIDSVNLKNLKLSRVTFHDVKGKINTSK